MKPAVLLLLALAASAAEAQYISASLANSTGGVATFNSSITGNATWRLSHESGAVLATSAVNLTAAGNLQASYPGVVGNLTGNFTFRVSANISAGTWNNSTIYYFEQRDAGFFVQPPAAPTPTPTPTPPPPPVTGELRILMLSPDPDRTVKETLIVSAIVTATNNTTVSEVRMAKERRAIRQAPAGGTPCDGVPSGWKVAASGNGTTYTRAWEVNTTEDPLEAGTYTVYVRAESNVGKVACSVVPEVGVKISPASAASPTPTPLGNVSVVATKCDGKPCSQGKDGPLIKGKLFQFQVDPGGVVAMCKPLGCDAAKELQAGQWDGFIPNDDGDYVLHALSASGPDIKRWKLGEGQFARPSPAPGLKDFVRKVDEIPCNPPVAKTGEDYKWIEETKSYQRIEYPVYLIPPASKGTICYADSPVYWNIIPPPVCPEVFAAGKRLANQSRDYSPDGTPGAWKKLLSFPVEMFCPGSYIVQTSFDPEADKWQEFAKFQTADPKGAELWFLFVGGVAGGIAARQVAVRKWNRSKVSLFVSGRAAKERGYDFFTDNTPLLKEKIVSTDEKGNKKEVYSDAQIAVMRKETKGKKNEPARVHYFVTLGKYLNNDPDELWVPPFTWLSRHNVRSNPLINFKIAPLSGEDPNMQKLTASSGKLVSADILYVEDEDRPKLITTFVDRIINKELKKYAAAETRRSAALGMDTAREAKAASALLAKSVEEKQQEIGAGPQSGEWDNL